MKKLVTVTALLLIVLTYFTVNAKACTHLKIKVKTATCKSEGKEKCTLCKKIFSVKKKAHQYQTSKKATCLSAGRKKCKWCTKTLSIPKTTHVWVWKVVPTKKQKGIKKCKICGSIKKMK